jgi:hypothetical protein
MALADDEGGGAIHGGFEGVSSVRVTQKVARQLLEGTGETPESLQQKIDADMKPRSLALPGKRMTVAVAVDSRLLTTRNVLGMVPGWAPTRRSPARSS